MFFSSHHASNCWCNVSHNSDAHGGATSCQQAFIGTYTDVMPIGMSNVNEPRAQEQSSSSFHCGLNSNFTIDTLQVQLFR
jgi:hypothetical protein